MSYPDEPEDSLVHEATWDNIIAEGFPTAATPPSASPQDYEFAQSSIARQYTKAYPTFPSIIAVPMP
ncbi:hypothetical protein SNOG_07334 [Parastagonospora nodorum SN15]|uniref:Uncharacterized protein n=1 Tax=Phaeosphaeria nodorum (strain SN15 / ATCC MYA-4574 / FGSC 10173) TaxID=321614 RepID=Q0ULN0_PHANO|nr:hypothetical protein SNOG_07334 [Parastagonospora nodorum SN15]EAT84800.1 hypothetical protein SNOG_07334 [Parastagonospora nodorum SN15]